MSAHTEQPTETKLKWPNEYYQFDTTSMKKKLDLTVDNIQKARNLGKTVKFDKKFSRIVYCGMGGSAIAGLLLKTYLGPDTPITVVREYDIPFKLYKEDLVICSSYSGNTEETLSAYKQANRADSTVVCASVGGKLKELCDINRTQHVVLPKGFEPRNAWTFQFFTALNILEQSGLTKVDESEIKSLITNLHPQKLDEIGQAFSEKLFNKIPVIYASTRWETLAYRWKTSINENSKVMAFYHVFPELNHNEVVGYTKSTGKFALVMLKFDDDHRRVHKRIEITAELAKKAGIEVIEIALKGNKLNKLFTGVLIGDYTSYYLGLRYKLDPAPVKIVENFKQKMGPYI